MKKLHYKIQNVIYFLIIFLFTVVSVAQSVNPSSGIKLPPTTIDNSTSPVPDIDSLPNNNIPNNQLPTINNIPYPSTNTTPMPSTNSSPIFSAPTQTPNNNAQPTLPPEPTDPEERRAWELERQRILQNQDRIKQEQLNQQIQQQSQPFPYNK